MIGNNALLKIQKTFEFFLSAHINQLMKNILYEKQSNNLSNNVSNNVSSRFKNDINHILKEDDQKKIEEREKRFLKKGIELKFNFAAWPIFTVIFPPLLYGTAFMLYFFQGRYIHYQPTISETGTRYPNTEFVARFFGTISTTTGFTMAITNARMLAQYPISNFLRKYLFLQCILEVNFMSMVGMNPMNENHFLHFLNAGVGFVSNLISQFILYVHIFRYQNMIQKVLRGIFMLIQAISLIIIGFTEELFENRNNITAAALAEYATIVFLSFFYCSFCPELEEYKWSIIDISDESNL